MSGVDQIQLRATQMHPRLLKVEVILLHKIGQFFYRSTR